MNHLSYRYLWIELAAWRQSLTTKRPWRRRKPFNHGRVYFLIAFTFCWEFAITLKVLGLVRPLGGW